MNAAMDLVERLLAHEGALVEPVEDRAMALLPPDLAAGLELPEEVTLDARGRDGVPCGYGSELLRRVVDRTLERGAVVAGVARTELPRQGPPPYSGVNVALRPGATSSAAVWTAIGHFVVDARATDRRELRVAAAVCLADGAPLPPPGALSLTPTDERPDAGALAAAADRLQQEARRAAMEALAPFLALMARRHRRDVLRVDQYFQELDADLANRARRSRGEAMAKKRATLPAERARRLHTLTESHTIQVQIQPVALVLARYAAAEIPLTVLRRKKSRTVTVRYDSLVRRWHPLVCEGCTDATMSFGACDDAVHILCARCVAEARCPRCAGRRPAPALTIKGSQETVLVPGWAEGAAFGE